MGHPTFRVNRKMFAAAGEESMSLKADIGELIDTAYRMTAPKRLLR